MRDLVHLYITERRSIPQIAALLNQNRSAVRNQLRSLGVEIRSRAEGVRLRRDALSEARKGKTRTFSQEWRDNISASRRRFAEKHAAGTSVKPNGYVEVTRGANKGRTVHVLKVEARIGRRLLPDECVHHIDGNRANNSDDNLALMTRAGHARLHRREQRITGG